MKPVSETVTSNNPFKGMRRFPDDGWVAGVCAGIAAHFDWSVKVVRIIAVVLLFASGGYALLAYLILWYVLDPVTGASAPTASGSPGGPYPSSPGSGPSTGEVHARFAGLETRLRRLEECVTDEAYQLRRELRKLEP